MDGPTYTRQWEGELLSAYQDEFGNWTIGIGHKLGNGDWSNTVWTQSQVEQVFANDYADAEETAQNDLGNLCWETLSEPRQAAVIDMAFNIGQRGLQGFHKMAAFLINGDWHNAAAQVLSSKYAQQLPRRAASNAAIIASGEWPNG